MSPLAGLETPGNMVFVEGDDEAKLYLRGGRSRVNDWLYELTDAAIFFAADRIRREAPGGIDQLVETELPHELEPGVIEGIAGVEPDITDESFQGPTIGLGSNPADYPVFVEVGTGVFGPIGKAISTIPGKFMRFPAYGAIGLDLDGDNSNGGLIFTQIVKGQKPQHYTEHAFEQTVAWMPAEIRTRLPDLARE